MIDIHVKLRKSFDPKFVCSILKKKHEKFSEENKY